MKFYRHYKNKNYRLLGHVRHSETLEEMALYECRYPNELGTLWVRPREMFYGDIELDGKKVARFAKVPLNIQSFTAMSPAEISQVTSLSEKIFANNRNQDVSSLLADKKDPLLLIAEVDGQAVGYKLGYQLDSETFYSWLGGVLPSYRGLGIATDLMNAQHEWCQQKGYKKVQTKTSNQFPEMLTLNVKAGFKIVGTKNSSKDGELRIIMEKVF